MSGPVGQRRHASPPAPDAGLVARLAAVATTDLSDAMHHAGAMHSGVGPLYTPFERFAGPAVTVSAPAGSLEARRAAIEVLRPGDVLVIEARAISAWAVLGGSLAERIRSAGAVGVVLEGCARDVDEIRELELPVLCRGHGVGAAPRVGPGEVNVPVACGGVVVTPGDVVVGDVDGAVVVPRGHEQEVLDAVAARLAGA